MINMRMFHVLSLFLILSYASAAVDNGQGLVNSDGCYCKLSGAPDYVCPGAKFTVHASIFQKDDKSGTTVTDYPVTVTGSPGASVVPTDIRTCPAEKDLDVIAGQAGTLVLAVGGCKLKVLVLGNTSGDWTAVYTPYPKPPLGALPGGHYDYWTPPISGVLTFPLEYHKIGDIFPSFVVTRDDQNWVPNSDGGGCGDKIVIDKTYSSNVTVSLSIQGILSIGGSYSASVSVTHTIDGVPGTRFRAYGVTPGILFTENRTWTAYEDGVFGRQEVTSLDDFSQGDDDGIGYLAGADYYLEAECCFGTKNN